MARKKQPDWEQFVAKVSILYAQGLTHQEIAIRLGLADVTESGRQRVYRAIKAIRQVWREQVAANFDELRGQRRSQLEWAMRETAAAWEASKEIKPPGNSRYIDAYRRITMDLCELDGLISRNKEDPQGVLVPVIALKFVQPAELEAKPDTQPLAS